MLLTHSSGLTGRLILILLLCLAARFPVFGDETEPVNPEGSVTLTSITFDIDGNTREKALMKELRVAEGRVYESYEILEAVLIFRTRELENRRLFVEFEWELRPAGPDAAALHIRLVDSFTLFPRPMFSYSSSTGILLGAKVEYFNAFGTLTDWILEGYWSPEEIKIRLDVQQIVVGRMNLDSAFEQYFGSTKYGSPAGNILVEYDSIYSLFSTLLTIPLGPISPWSYDLEPLVLWQYGYEWVTNSTAIPDSEFENPGFAFGLNHGFNTDQVYWTSNFRRGFMFSFMNENIWYTQTSNQENLLESDLAGYLPLGRWFEISGRLGGFYAFEGIREDAGDRLRGVVDYQAWGEWGVFASAQFNFRVTPTGGFMEAQLRPFVDVGYVYSEVWGNGPDAWEYCVGSTLIVFLRPLPSMVLNVEFGWDFKREQPEIILGTRLIL